MELTAAGLSGTFTRFPFHLKPQERRFTEQDFAKVGNFFECAIIRCGFMMLLPVGMKLFVGKMRKESFASV